MSSPPSSDAVAHSDVNPKNKELKGTYGQGGRTTLNIDTAGFNKTNPSLVYASMSSKYFGDPMSDSDSSFSSTFFSKVNTLERMTVQEVDSGSGFTSLGYASEYFSNLFRSHFSRTRTDEGA